MKNYTLTKEALIRVAKTFIQALIAFLVVALPTIDFTQDKSALKAALFSVLASAVAAGLSAVMNIEQKGGSNGMKFSAWVKKFLGKKTDYDGVYGVQCVDLIDCYIHECLGLDKGFWGNAKFWWLNRKSSAWLKKNFEFITPNYKNGELKKGDIGIRTSGTYGHIFVIAEPTKNGKVKYYDQNATGNGDKMTLREKAYNSSTVNGILRPKNQKNLKEAKVYKTVKANGGLFAYSSLNSTTAYTIIPNGTKVEVVSASAGAKTIKSKKYTMSKIKYNGATYYVAQTYLK
ncbi:MAG: CHAP domain-containing protein [Eubacteriales bacterium]|nr:CHAP domain-containing protein [Eubacteriales bacterium]